MIREAKRASYYVIRFNLIKFSTASHNARYKFPIHQKANENEPTVTPTANYVTCCRRRVASPVGGSSSALHPAGDSVSANASDRWRHGSDAISICPEFRKRRPEMSATCPCSIQKTNQKNRQLKNEEEMTGYIIRATTMADSQSK
jgi:hypothetical protein